MLEISATKTAAMYLFFDTETTGLPRNWKAPITDLNNWPRLVQLAWMLFDNAGNLLDSKNQIVKPLDFKIPEMSARIHGITNERALSEGVELKRVLQDFCEVLDHSNVLVAHNMSFDEKIVGAELLRMGGQNSLEKKHKICTMLASTAFCGLQGPFGFKWPKLSELHYRLFHENFDEAHNAAVDITITAKCFWELKKYGVFKEVVTS